MAFSSSRGRAIVLTLAFGTLCGLDNLTLLASSLSALLLPYLLQLLASCSASNPPGLKTFAFVLLYANMPLPQIATGLSSNATFSTWLSVPTLVIAAQSSLTAVLPAPPFHASFFVQKHHILLYNLFPCLFTVCFLLLGYMLHECLEYYRCSIDILNVEWVCEWTVVKQMKVV